MKALEDEGLDYALCGGVALAVHGIPRATKDIDILVPPSAVERVRAVARSCGFKFDALPMTFRSSGISVRRFAKLIEGQPLMLDVLVADSVLQEVWERRERVEWQEGRLSVVSVDGLVTMKLAAARPQDLADVERLRELQDG